MTFLLVVTVYSVAVGEPSFGIMGPLVIGAAVYAAAITGGSFTGAALNPARVLGECAWLSNPPCVWVPGQLPGCVAGERQWQQPALFAHIRASYPPIDTCTPACATAAPTSGAWRRPLACRPCLCVRLLLERCPCLRPG
jgi:hypothetical protein